MSAVLMIRNCPVQETWRPVVGWENRYEVSDLGRVRTASGRILAPLVRGDYLRAGLGSRAERTRRSIHVLVLEAFVGPRPEGMEARHLDGDSKNNALVNLAWGTHLENMADRERHGRTPRGDRNTMAKLTSAQVEEIKAAVGAGELQRVVAQRFGVSDGHVCRLVNGRRRGGFRAPR